ncbi:MAG: DUF1836 domain-containing protein [Syntrophomonadaceae bacterium]
MLSKSSLEVCIRELQKPTRIDLADIPDIDLYMDQVLTFLETRLSEYKRGSKDKVFTKTMINNYAKAGIILSPKKKKYSRENMVLLLLMYRLKHIMSIQDISALFAPLLERGDGHESIIGELYTLFLEIEELGQEGLGEQWLDRADTIGQLCSQTSLKDNEQMEWLLLVLSLISQADLQRRLAERIIDVHFGPAS